MLLQIEERQIPPDIAVLDLAGKLALGPECQRLETAVEDLLARSARRIILEMTKVDYADSAGIGALALAAGKIKEAGGALVVVTGPGRVLDMLKQTQIILLVTVRATFAEALTSIGGIATGA